MLLRRCIGEGSIKKRRPMLGARLTGLYMYKSNQTRHGIAQPGSNSKLGCRKLEPKGNSCRANRSLSALPTIPELWRVAWNDS